MDICTGPRLPKDTDAARARDAYSCLFRDADAPISFSLCRNDPKIWLAVFRGRLMSGWKWWPHGADASGLTSMKHKLDRIVNG